MNAIWLTALLAAGALAAHANLCPNPGAEEGGPGPSGWESSAPGATWAAGEAHTGTHSLKVVGVAGATISWTSAPIARPAGVGQLMLSLWARLDQVTGQNGAYATLYHLNAAGERIGQSAGVSLGGNGSTVATSPWREYVAMGTLPDEVKAVRVNLRLYGATGTAWFDDVAVTAVEHSDLTAPRPLRRGLALRTGRLAIVDADGAGPLAGKLRAALAAKGVDAPVLPHATVDLTADARDLLILGNLVTSRAAEWLYRQSYAYEDRYFPGGGGLVLRPLVDPVGNGGNRLVVAGSDSAGQAAAVERLLAALPAAQDVLDVPLTVKTGAGYVGLAYFPWAASGPRREMQPAAAYLKSGDPAQAKAYRDALLKSLMRPDRELFSEDTALHLYYVTLTQSWDLMDASGAFTDDERLAIERQFLKVLRSDQGYGYSGLAPGLFCRENHATRAAEAFYYGWRHFQRHYARELGPELTLWRSRLEGFWTACFASSRSYEDSLSQHALGGSLENILDLAFMEPEWAREFFASGRAKRMGERCLAICNNRGETVMLGDTNASDYPASVFAKLAYALGDGRYRFMLDLRAGRGSSSDEPLRGFVTDLKPARPDDAVGLDVVALDPLYFHTALQNKAGVELDRAFDKLALRSGFNPADEYLMLDGVAGGSHSYDDANSLGEFSADGRRWLVELDIFNGPTMSHHNAVTVARDGLGLPQVPQAAELVDRAAGDGWAYTATRLPRYNGVGWTRHLLWQPKRYTVVLDELTAEEPGSYTFGLGWRSLGAPKLEPGRLTLAQDEPPRPAVSLRGPELVAAVTGSSGRPHRLLEGYDSLFYRAEQPGDWIELGLTVPREGEYALRLTGVTFTGRAIVQAALDGQAAGAPIDLLGPAQAQSKGFDLGRRRLTAGRHTLRLTVTGKNGASTGYTVAVQRVELLDGRQTEPTPHRCQLVFPPDVPASLDRDTEVLGPYLPPSPDHDAALNVLDQALSRTLAKGQAAAFVNVFAAGPGGAGPLELRRLDEHAVLVRDGDGVALVAAGVDGVDLRCGELRVTGRLACLGPQAVRLHGATATLAGQPLAEGPAPAALSQALTALWAATPARSAAAASAWGGLPAPKAAWSADTPGAPLSLAVRPTPDGAAVSVGTADGVVTELDAKGAPRGRVQLGGPVHALCAANLGGPAPALVAGSDDEHVTVLGPDLAKLWQAKVPMLAELVPWSWWTLGSAKVRAVAAADLDGDGRDEVLAGAGNIFVHCYDAAGRERWHFRCEHGTPSTLTTAVLQPGGRPLVLAGNGISSSSGTCWILNGQGKVVSSLYNDGWCTSLPAIAVGEAGGQPLIVCGNNRGNVRAYRFGGSRPEALWLRNLTRPVRSITLLPGGVAVVGSDSGYLTAFDAAGNRAWGVPLSGAIVATALARRKAAPPLLAAGCKDGHLFVLNTKGELLAHTVAGNRLELVKAADLDGDGNDEVLTATSDPARVAVWKP